MKAEDVVPDPASFRDSAGQVFRVGPRVFRSLNEQGQRIWQDLTTSGLFDALRAPEKIVRTWTTTDNVAEISDLNAPDAATLEHEAIPFLSFAYEWSFALLKRAALLHLDILDDAIPRGFILRDATPFNVQFVGTRPTFIDVLSVERRKKGEAWTGYGQFCETMLYPLMIAAYAGVSFRPWMKDALDGIPPHVAARVLGRRSFFRRGVLTHVKLNEWSRRLFQNDPDINKAQLRTAELPVSALQKMVRGLRTVIDGLTLRDAKSHWSGYAAKNSYEGDQSARKKAFVEKALREARPDLVWDVGCNTGDYSLIAAPHARTVVALDDDEATVDALVKRCDTAGVRNVLPLVLPWGAPSPGLGWRNEERPAFLRRSRPDAVLYLAVMHHLAVRGHISLERQMALLRDLTGSVAVVEYVDRADSMFRHMTRNMENAFEDYSRGAFLRSLENRFSVVATEKLSDTREMFLLKATP